jgi:hypothetical protein
MTPRSRPSRHREVGAQLQQTGRRVTKGAAMPVPKVTLLPALTYFRFTTLEIARLSFTTTMPTRLSGYFTLYLLGKLKSCRTSQGSAVISTHATATAMLFPVNSRLIFLTDELTCDRYLVDTGVTLSIVPCNAKTTPSGPFLKGADGQPIPSWGFV